MGSLSWGRVIPWYQVCEKNMWRLISLVGVALLAARCGGDAPTSAPRRRPEHPEDGTPPFGDETDRDPEVEQASAEVGSSLDLFVQAQKGGREGCGILRVEEILFDPAADGAPLTLSARARWASYPPSFLNGGQVSSGVAYRAGDFPVSWVTEEYPEYGTLGLKFLVTGSYNLQERRLRMMLENIDVESGGASGLFLAPVYEPWTDGSGNQVTCRADEEIDNEFFVGVPAEEVEFALRDPGREAVLCGPCEPPVERVGLEIR